MCLVVDARPAAGRSANGGAWHTILSLCFGGLVLFAPHGAFAQHEPSTEGTLSSPTDIIHAQAQAHLVLSAPLTKVGDLWAGFQITAQATWDWLPVSVGMALVVLPFSSAPSDRGVYYVPVDGPVRVIPAERSDVAMALDPYVQAHLPLDFAFTPFVEAAFGPRFTQTRHSLRADDGESEIELESQTHWNWEYNFGVGLAWFYDQKQRWKGSVASIGAQYGAVLGPTEAKVAVGSDEVLYSLPQAAIRVMLGWGQRF